VVKKRAHHVGHLARGEPQRRQPPLAPPPPDLQQPDVQQLQQLLRENGRSSE
jgi:hypothetical protein